MCATFLLFQYFLQSGRGASGYLSTPNKTLILSKLFLVNDFENFSHAPRNLFPFLAKNKKTIKRFSQH
jgi:hypothetical protein